ncbi:MAG: tetratricopeptide repeat protein [Bacteroidetes bacterium]|nr:tetratricopeptide repeat protein [Bacteroidota bacterium]
MDLIEQNSSSLIRLIRFFEKQSITEDYSFFEISDFESIIKYYLKSNNKDKAFEASSIAIKYYPYSIPILILNVELLIDKSEHEEALDLLERAEMIASNDSKIQQLLGRIYFELGEKEEAIQHLDQAIRLDNSTKNYNLFLKALVFLQHENFGEALKLLRNVINEDLKNEEAIIEFAQCYETLDEPENAIAIYQQIIDKNTYSEYAWNNLGLIYNYQSKYELAFDAFDMALTLNSKNPVTYFNLGNNYLDQTLYKKAIENYKESIRFGREDYLVYMQLGYSYLFMEENEKAQLFFSKSLKLNKNYPDCWFGLGLSLSNQEKYEDAITHLEKAVELFPFNDKFWYELANCYSFSSDYKKTRDAFIQSLEINPYNTVAVIDFALFLHDHKKTEIAVERLMDAITLNDKNAEYYYILAGILYDSKHEDADFYLEKALKLDPNKAGLLFEYFPFIFSEDRIVNLIDSKGGTITLFS